MQDRKRAIIKVENFIEEDAKEVNEIIEGLCKSAAEFGYEIIGAYFESKTKVKDIDFISNDLCKKLRNKDNSSNEQLPHLKVADTYNVEEENDDEPDPDIFEKNIISVEIIDDNPESVFEDDQGCYDDPLF